MANTEKYRLNPCIYQWRIGQEYKDSLFSQALFEGRTANQILADALKVYVCATPEERAKIMARNEDLKKIQEREVIVMDGQEELKSE